MVQSEGGQVSTNLINFYNSFNWIDEFPFTVYDKVAGSPIYSYLEDKGEGGYSRIEAIGEKVYVEEYSLEFKYLSVKELPMELPLFGGYYKGEKYRFFVFGQTNFDEIDEAEVLRIVKYDMEWNRISSVSVYGANTVAPFDAGSLRMTEVNGTLCIHTSHMMYKTSDGKNHQANMTFMVDEETMEVTQEYYKIMNISEGYVSHSFNQFVVSDGTYLYRLDHGDGYPRAVVVTKCLLSQIDSCKKAHAVVPIPVGDIGKNETGVSVGGFQITGDLLVSVGNSVEFDDTVESIYGVRNIYVTTTDTEFTGTNKTWITDYTEESAIEVGVPKLIKASEDTFYVMWEEADTANQLLFFRIAKISSTGELLHKSEPIYGRMSDCEPVYTADGRLVWYANFDSAPVFYNIDTNHLEDYHFSKVEIGKCDITLEQEECVYIDFNKGDNIIPVTVTCGDYTLKEERDYTLAYSKTNKVGKVTITLEGKGYFTGKTEKTYNIRPEKVESLGVCGRTKESLKFRWKEADFATGYQLEQKQNEKWVLIQDLAETEVEITGLESYTCYEFRVRAYTEEDGEVYYGDYCEDTAYTLLDDLVLKEPKLDISSVTLEWEPVDGAVKYEIYWHTAVGNVTIPTTLETTETSYTLTDLKRGSHHSFYVIAYTEDEKTCSAKDSVSVTLPSLLEEESTEIIYEDRKYVYEMGKEIEPYVRVNRGYSTLEKDKDYLLTYENNMEPGTGKIVVTGIDRYRGTVEKTFEIVPRSIEDLNGTATTDTIKLSWKPASGATGYYVYAEKNDIWDKSETEETTPATPVQTEEKEGWIRIGRTSQTTYEVTGLKENTTYRFKVASFAEKNKKIYEGYSFEEVEIKTKQKAEIPSYEKVTPTPVVTGSATVTPGQDVTPNPTVQGMTPIPPGQDITPIPTVQGMTPTPSGQDITPNPTVQGTTSTLPGQDITLIPTVQANPTPVTSSTVIPTPMEEVTPTPVGDGYITPAVEETLSSKRVKLSKTSYTYNGKAKKPSVTVRNEKGEKLKAGKDYAVVYSKGRKNVGVYKVTIKGMDGYSGTVEKTFKICPKTTKVTKAVIKDGEMKVSWKKGSGSIKGYEIQYSVSPGFKKTGKLSINKKKTTSKQIKNLKENKKYYVRIRTYQTVKVDGKKVKLYSDWSKKKIVKP